MAVSAVPLVVAPAISAISGQLQTRPQWEKGAPFKVTPELYKSAAEEMTAIMKKRGFPLPASKPLMMRGVDNFLLFGTPIVSS